MSPRAACRLEVFGFSTVYDYVLGKTDWMGAGLPTVRADASETRAIDVVDREPPTCSTDTSLRELPNGRSVVVVSGDRTVIGRISSRQSRDEPGVAADVLQPGPTTVRAHEPLLPLLERMAKAHVTEMLVTTPEGRLLGVVHVPDDAR
jgi:hypothetical protein